MPRSSRKSVTGELFQQWLNGPDGGTEGGGGGGLGALLGSLAGGGRSPSPAAAASSSAGVRLADLELLEKNDRLMELILDISNELDINTLCHKILLNVGHLTRADRCSLFLARGPRDNRYLEAKLFDVDATTSKHTAIILWEIFPNILLDTSQRVSSVFLWYAALRDCSLWKKTPLLSVSVLFLTE